MKVELDRKDIINLLKGAVPPYEMMNRLIELKLGSYTGGFSDKWDWDIDIKSELSDNALFNIYKSIKSYWASRKI